jgi:hypothetical protein
MYSSWYVLQVKVELLLTESGWNCSILTRSAAIHPKRIAHTNCCIYTVNTS